MQNTKLSRFYLPELDGLRFVAFLLVFIHNAPYITSNRLATLLHQYGWVGVDIFFCLSAFIITKLLTCEYERDGKINFGNFYRRRALRIWPLYFLYIAAVLFFYLKQNYWDSNISNHLLSLTFFIVNLLTGLLGPNPVFQFVHLWTISYEIQFYLIAPWLIRYFYNITNNQKIFFLGMIVVMGNFIRWFFIDNAAPHPVVYELPFTHFDSMIGGLALGWKLFDQPFSKIRQWHSITLGILSLGSIVLLPNIEVNGLHLILTYSLAGIGSTLIIYGATRKGWSIIDSAIGNIRLAYLGKISYGLYVYHITSLIIAEKIIHRIGINMRDVMAYPIAMQTIGLILTLIFSIASYQLIEKPFLHLKERLASIHSRPV